MKVRVLGSAAGGRVPQWNCGCANCRDARAGKIQARTQDSIAVSGDGEGWLLCNASPDVSAQIEATPDLHPRAPRHSPIRAIVLTNGDVDHTVGLFSLRESYPLVVYATQAVWTGILDNVLVRTLQRFEGQTTWKRVVLGERMAVEGTGLFLTARAAPGKRPVHLEKLGEPSEEDNVALWIERGGAPLVYAPGAASVEPVSSRIEGAQCLFFDGTFWSEDELPRLGLGKGRAKDMAHVPISGDAGSLRGFDGASSQMRRIYTHINNTNPILLPGSEERTMVEAAGWEIARDGMELELT